MDDLDEGTDTLQGYVSLFHGPRPELASCNSEVEELDGLRAWIDHKVECGIQLADIGILVNTRAGVKHVCDALRATGLNVVQLQPNVADDRSIPGIRVTTMHRAKGLEFFAIAIPFL